MIYYPCESGTGWADPLLNLLGYNREKNPAKVSKIQHILDLAFRECTRKMEIEGTEVIPVALSAILDSQNAEHYENRVEPSVLGGMLMGHSFFDIVNRQIGVSEPEFQSHEVEELNQEKKKKKKGKKKGKEEEKGNDNNQ
jgi:hypothetical protein